MLRRRTVIALAATVSMLSALVGIGASEAADPVKIRLSYVVPIANWAPMLLEKKDLARNLGKTYQLEITRFAGTPPQITALANGELDIADLTYPTLPIAIENAGMDDLRVISDEFQDGNAGHYSNEFMVLTDGPIKRVEDLKGKAVAVNQSGSAVDIAMRAMLRKHGLEDKRDYTVVEAAFPTMRAAMTPRTCGPEMKPLEPKPPPRNGLRMWILSGDMPKSPARRPCAITRPWLGVSTESVSPSHAATIACGSIAL